MKKIVVIGAGIIGAATAAKLSEAGMEVTVLEKGGIASAASGGNVGQISIVDRTDDWHLALTKDALEIYKRIEEKYPIEFDQIGGTTLIKTEKELAKAKELKGSLAKEGISCDIYLGDDVEKVQSILMETDIIGVLQCHQEGVINPLKTTMTFIDIARENGAKINEHTPVKGFEKEGNHIVGVVTENKVFEADYIINCAGSWTSNVSAMADMDVSLSWKRGTAMVSAPVSPIITGQISGNQTLSGDITVVGTKSIVAGLSQTRDGSIVLAQATEESDVDSKEISSQGVFHMAKKNYETFPKLKDIEIVRIWAAVTPFSKDGKPFFGFGKKADNMLVVAGFKGAFTTAPAIAVKVLDLLENNASWGIPEFNPER